MRQGRPLAYRPGLDGVRALAVAAVILYHGQVSVADGGFLGVDVFFVLSGFLITSLLLHEYARTGTVDLVRFWLARVRRLVPALVVVVVVSLAVIAIFSSEDLPSLRGDAFWSLLYVNNWHQVLAERSYFEAFGRPSLLQHFWSLAVEEQFYLLWPPLLMIGLRRLGAGRVAALALCGALVSALLMALLHDPREDLTRVYFGTDTRAFPLLIGVLLAFAWPAMRSAQPIEGRARAGLDGLGLAGLLIVLAGVVGWSDYDPFLYPWGLLLVALGAAMLIASCAHPSSRVGVALGWAPLVWIGARSYGMYLWHWPVMAMTRPEADVHITLWVLVPLQIAATVGLAALSYKYVEMPIRRRELQARVRAWLASMDTSRRRAVTAAAPAGVILIALLALWPTAGRQLPAGPSVSASALARAAVPTAPASTTPSDPRELAREQRAGMPAMRDAPRGPILAVGASVMLAAIDPLQRRLHARVDAAVSRQPSEILDRLEAYKAAGDLPPVVVVQMGENGPVWYDDLQRLRNVLDDVPRVVIMNVRASTVSWIDDVNAKLEGLVEDWPQAELADWYDASADANLRFDGAHPNAQGGIVYARLLADAIGR
jgi:peptidoglycan/LPS O-acetylase OafA/YrhL